MTEVSLVFGLFCCIGALIFLFNAAHKKSIEIDQKAKEWEKKAFVYKTLIEGRKKTRDFKEARRNAARRRDDG